MQIQEKDEAESMILFIIQRMHRFISLAYLIVSGKKNLQSVKTPTYFFSEI